MLNGYECGTDASREICTYCEGRSPTRYMQEFETIIDKDVDTTLRYLSSWHLVPI